MMNINHKAPYAYGASTLAQCIESYDSLEAVLLAMNLLIKALKGIGHWTRKVCRLGPDTCISIRPVPHQW